MTTRDGWERSDERRSPLDHETIASLTGVKFEGVGAISLEYRNRHYMSDSSRRMKSGNRSLLNPRSGPPAYGQHLQKHRKIFA
jgi:hypothetical protein